VLAQGKEAQLGPVGVDPCEELRFDPVGLARGYRHGLGEDAGDREGHRHCADGERETRRVRRMVNVGASHGPILSSARALPLRTDGPRAGRTMVQFGDFSRD
jgi:hypothetical protein